MRIIKLIVISAVVLFLLITALSLLLPSHVRISRATNIFSGDARPYIADLREWKKWNRFIQEADSMKTLGKVTDSFIRAGDIEIRLIKKTNAEIQTTWTQLNKKPSECTFVVLPGDNYNVVQWYFDFHLDWYPWQKFQSIIYDNQLGPHMEASLENLKRLSEPVGNGQ
jgi:hypothetical protein